MSPYLAPISKRQQLFSLLLGLVLLFSFLSWFFITSQSPKQVPLAQHQAVQIVDDGDPIDFGSNTLQLRPSIPVRVIIPKLNIDAPVESLGLTATGAMATPDGPLNTSWYNLGTRPGEIGSAVIAGHFGWENRTPAVFDDLHTLQPNDQIFVEQDGGQNILFLVDHLEGLAWDADATKVFSSSDGDSHLNLITCEGQWDAILHRYPSRLIVYSRRSEF